jgi:tripartite-type tricarboxylate transporter receptor subunit TctC
LVRTISDDLYKALDQPVVIENRDGAGGNIGTMIAAGAAPDGYTFLVAPTPSLVINQHLFRSFKIDPLKAFVPVIYMAYTPSVLWTNGNVPANDFKAFIAHARAQKGRLNFGSPGVGSPPHLTLAALNEAQQLNMVSVTYRGSAPVFAGLLSGELDLGFARYGDGAPYMKTGKLRPLAVMGEKRLRMLPDTPTFAEVGMGDVGRATFWALVAPRGVPEPILERMNAAFRAALATPKAQQLADTGIVPVGGTRQDAAEKINQEAVLWPQLLKRLNFPMQD